MSVYGYMPWVSVLWMPGLLELGLQATVSCRDRCWESSSGPQKEQHVILTTGLPPAIPTLLKSFSSVTQVVLNTHCHQEFNIHKFNFFIWKTFAHLFLLTWCMRYFDWMLLFSSQKRKLTSSTSRGDPFNSTHTQTQTHTTNPAATSNLRAPQVPIKISGDGPLWSAVGWNRGPTLEAFHQPWFPLGTRHTVQSVEKRRAAT